MQKHTFGSISNKVLNDAVPGMPCVLRAEAPVTREGLIRDYLLQGKDKGLPFPRLSALPFIINFVKTRMEVHCCKSSTQRV